MNFGPGLSGNRSPDTASYSPPTSILFLRTNIRWSELTPEAFRDLERTNPTARRTKSIERRRIASAIAAWNSWFSLTYFEYRHRLREIAQANWANIRDLDVMINNSARYDSLDSYDDYRVFPVDDDDWFHPDVVREIRRADTGDADAFSWPDAVYGSLDGEDLDAGIAGTGGTVRLRRRPERFLTNNYCLTRSGIIACGIDRARQAVVNHGFAWKLFKSSMFKRQRLDRYLSVTCKSLASTMNLLTVRSPDQFLPRLEKTLGKPAAIPAEVHWAAPYMRQVERLNQDLYESRQRASQ